MGFRPPQVLDLPPMEPPITVVGDVHLSEHEPQVARRFFAFLERVQRDGGRLILLGDVFDWWVSPSQARRSFEKDVLSRLARVADAGVALSFVAGNRDFAFDGADGLAIETLPDAVRTRWGDRTVLLTHGDLLCTLDTGYLALRRVLRSWPVRAGMRLLPLRALSWFARGLRRHSERHGRRTAGAVAGIDYAAALRWMEEQDADVLVAGHVHTGVHHRLPGPRPRDVLVLRDWDHEGGVVRYDGLRVRLETP